MRLSIVTTLFISLVILACNKNSRVEDDCESGCKPSRVCTEEFRSLMVQVVDRAGTPVTLDSFVVVSFPNRELIINNPARTLLPGREWNGIHLLFADRYKDKTSTCGEQFEFEGYMGKQLVVSRTYIIAHDCCHVNLKSGDTKIVIDK